MTTLTPQYTLHRLDESCGPPYNLALCGATRDPHNGVVNVHVDSAVTLVWRPHLKECEACLLLLMNMTTSYVVHCVDESQEHPYSRALCGAARDPQNAVVLASAVSFVLTHLTTYVECEACLLLSLEHDPCPHT